MEFPATWMTRHLMWTRSGVVWATWRLQAANVRDRPVVYPHASLDTQKMIVLHHQALFQALRGEALLLGLCADMDPSVLTNKMIDGVDLRLCPEWAEEAELQLKELEEVPVGARSFWLSVPLAARSVKERMVLGTQASLLRLDDALSRPRQAPAPEQVERMMERARDVEKLIPSVFQFSRATAAEQFWIAAHSAKRGLAEDTVMPAPAPMQKVAGARAPSKQVTSFQEWTGPQQFPTVWFDEGSQSKAGKIDRWFPQQRRRHLEVEVDAWGDTSYQVLLGLATSPREGWLSPGTEWASFVDQLPMEVDWAQRIHVTSAAETQRQNARAEQNLQDQFNQQEATSGSITGGTSSLEQIAQDLAEYHASLNMSDQEVGLRGAMLLAVGASTAEDVHAMAQSLVSEYGRHSFVLKAEAGEQENLWWSFIPGVPTEKIVRELQHPTTGREWATGVPLVTFDIGDQQGYKFGINISGGRNTPVFRDTDGAIVKNSSASFGIVGEKGGGKSVTLKDEAGTVVDRGGRIISIDRTDAREYATFAQSLDPGRTSIVDLTRPERSLDPLRTFGPRKGAAMVQSLFSAMLRVQPTSDMGEMLSELLDEKQLASHSITSLSELESYLADHNSDETKRLLRRMRVVSSKEFGQVLFDESLPPMDVDARAIVFLTAGLPVPTRSELEIPHLYDQLPLEKVVGRALHAMLMGMTREICFQDKTDLAGAIIDECYSVTQSPEGEQDVKLFLRDDRKHRAFLALGAQDVTPLGSPETRAMIKNRFVTRQSSEDLAFESVKWLTGVKNDKDVEQRYIDSVTDLSPFGADGKVLPGREGEMLMRDQLGRIGIVRKSLPARPHRREALLSTPPAHPLDEEIAA